MEGTIPPTSIASYLKEPEFTVFLQLSPPLGLRSSHQPHSGGWLQNYCCRQGSAVTGQG